MSKSPNRLLGIVMGVVYLVAGVTGFFLTSSTGFAATSGPRLLDLFEVNPLHNLLHIATGAVLLIAALVAAWLSRPVNLVMGACLFLLGGAGALISSGNNPLNILALDGADNVLYFASAVVLLAVAIGADRTVGSAKTA
jgi:hypothetical protein